ncbi:MAG: hypothetical protein CSA58_05300, partial [Micrococcales bacterium]
HRASWAWIRRYPYLLSLSVNALTTNGASWARRCAVTETGRLHQSWKPEVDTCNHRHICVIVYRGLPSGFLVAFSA